MFDFLLQTLADQGGGVRAFTLCACEARARIAAEPGRAAALLMIALAAQRFVDTYDDQPLPADAAEAERARFTALLASLGSAYASGSAADREAALNAAALGFALAGGTLPRA